MLKTAMTVVVVLAILAGQATAAPWEEDLAQRRAVACSDQPQQASARPILEVLPINAASSDRDLALFALPYGDLVSYVRLADLRQSDPPGFARGPDADMLLAALDPGAKAFATLAGLQVATFIHCSAPAIVIVFDATDPADPRDLLVGLMRQILGGWSPFSLRFVDAVSIAFPSFHISIVGHSSGGGLASYAAGARNLPSITFNASRTIAATTNDGSKQLNVIVLNDPIADPNALSLRPIRGPRALAGINLWLDVEVERPLLELHDLSTIMTGLGQLL